MKYDVLKRYRVWLDEARQMRSEMPDNFIPLDWALKKLEAEIRLNEALVIGKRMGVIKKAKKK